MGSLEYMQHSEPIPLFWSRSNLPELGIDIMLRQPAHIRPVTKPRSQLLIRLFLPTWPSPLFQRTPMDQTQDLVDEGSPRCIIESECTLQLLLVRPPSLWPDVCQGQRKCIRIIDGQGSTCSEGTAVSVARVPEKDHTFVKEEGVESCAGVVGVCLGIWNGV